MRSSKYIISYILPLPFNLFMMWYFMGVNIEILSLFKIGHLEYILRFLLIIEMTVIISFFNYLGYRSTLKNIDKEKSLSIYKKLVIINAVIMTMIISII